MSDEFLEALNARPARENDPASALVRPLTLSLVPAGAAIVAAMVHRDAAAMFWPPSPLLLLAPAVTYLVMRRVSTNGVEVAATAAMSGLVALFASWVVGLVLGLFAALECLGPGGGCIPW